MAEVWKKAKFPCGNVSFFVDWLIEVGNWIIELVNLEVENWLIEMENSLIKMKKRSLSII
ncbi:hypothetical protein ACFFIX_15735 [Metabacillus herbersteinensis]|uniref:Uncharacterized protein n=1 Tax=Metabacillus herbersteinensis TaxID=283816 RepID=A0ABV6GGR8_9BACI